MHRVFPKMLLSFYCTLSGLIFRSGYKSAMLVLVFKGSLAVKQMPVSNWHLSNLRDGFSVITNAANTLLIPKRAGYKPA